MQQSHTGAKPPIYIANALNGSVTEHSKARGSHESHPRNVHSIYEKYTNPVVSSRGHARAAESQGNQSTHLYCERAEWTCPWT